MSTTTSEPACHYHAQPAAAVCSTCGQWICLGCLRPDDLGIASCAACVEEEAATEAADPALGPVPFEQEGSIAARVFATWKGVILEPASFFVRVRQSRSWLAPALLAYTALVFGVALQLSYAIEFGALDEQFAQMSQETGVAVESIQALWLIALPFVVPLQILFGTILLHLPAKLLGGRAPLLKSFQLHTYAIGTAAVFYAIPYIGPFIVAVVLVLSQIVGLRVMHDLSLGRAFIACLPIAFIAAGDMMMV